MKKIYFSKDNDPSTLRRWRKSAMSLITGACVDVFPRGTLKMAEKILATPSRPKNVLTNMDWSISTVNVYDHAVKVYQAGSFDRSVIFVHGWSGSAGDFNAYYQPLLELGYNIVTFDHVAHGQSSGKTANLFLFVKAVEQMLSSLQGKTEVAGVVAHSMGGSAAISVLQKHYGRMSLVLVSPVIPFFESLYQSVTGFGISEKWIDGLIDVFERRYGRSVDDIDPKLFLDALSNPLLTIQDRNDRHIPLELNKKYFPPRVIGSLYETEGLGHFRILADTRVVSRVIGFVDGASH